MQALSNISDESWNEGALSRLVCSTSSHFGATFLPRLFYCFAHTFHCTLQTHFPLTVQPILHGHHQWALPSNSRMSSNLVPASVSHRRFVATDVELRSAT